MCGLCLPSAPIRREPELLKTKKKKKSSDGSIIELQHVRLPAVRVTAILKTLSSSSCRAKVLISPLFVRHAQFTLRARHSHSTHTYRHVCIPGIRESRHSLLQSWIQLIKPKPNRFAEPQLVSSCTAKLALRSRNSNYYITVYLNTV